MRAKRYLEAMVYNIFGRNYLCCKLYYSLAYAKMAESRKKMQRAGFCKRMAGAVCKKMKGEIRYGQRG